MTRRHVQRGKKGKRDLAYFDGWVGLPFAAGGQRANLDKEGLCGSWYKAQRDERELKLGRDGAQSRRDSVWRAWWSARTSSSASETS